VENQKIRSFGDVAVSNASSTTGFDYLILGLSRIPSFLDGPINASERGDFEQHSAEAFDQRSQTGLWHHWYKFIEHGALGQPPLGGPG
jgi:hypothetical protein